MRVLLNVIFLFFVMLVVLSCTGAGNIDRFERAVYRLNCHRNEIFVRGRCRRLVRFDSFITHANLFQCLRRDSTLKKLILFFFSRHPNLKLSIVFEIFKIQFQQIGTTPSKRLNHSNVIDQLRASPSGLPT